MAAPYAPPLASRLDVASKQIRIASQAQKSLSWTRRGRHAPSARKGDRTMLARDSSLRSRMPVPDAVFLSGTLSQRKDRGLLQEPFCRRAIKPPNGEARRRRFRDFHTLSDARFSRRELIPLLEIALEQTTAALMA